MTTLLDTGVVVDHLRGVERATEFLVTTLANGDAACSRLTMVELAVGMRPHQEPEFSRLLQFVDIIEVDGQIGQRAEQLARTWGRSHAAIDVTDYVIAATADLRQFTLATCNVKHFPMFEGLTAPY
ncbi:MAG: type II toxin-antitoxin system VapC family toxin [Thermoleophilia bacterium]|nr:type II toxin-antitoxin system VapC family toxin [Thermoleophilia bacterium]